MFAFVRGQHQQNGISDKGELHFLVLGAPYVFCDSRADLLLTVHKEAGATIDLQKDRLQIIHEEDIKAKDLTKEARTLILNFYEENVSNRTKRHIIVYLTIFFTIFLTDSELHNPVNLVYQVL